MILLVVVASELVACGGQSARRKVAVYVAVAGFVLPLLRRRPQVNCWCGRDDFCDDEAAQGGTV